jgi:hypothetical protein
VPSDARAGMTMLRRLVVALAVLLGLSSAAFSAPQNYLFLGGDDPADYTALLVRPDIAGVQVVYTWRELEPQSDKYDFARIDADLAAATAAGKQLVLQVQDRFFSPDARNIPDYLLTDPAYGGGLVAQTDNAGATAKGSGWVAMQWNDALRAHFQKLLAALATRYDGRIGGLTLPETAIDIDMKHDETGFSCDAYFAAEMDNLAAARRVFSRTPVVQYVNFWPCEWNDDHHYMSRLFDFAVQQRHRARRP